MSDSKTKAKKDVKFVNYTFTSEEIAEARERMKRQLDITKRNADKLPKRINKLNSQYAQIQSFSLDLIEELVEGEIDGLNEEIDSLKDDIKLIEAALVSDNALIALMKGE